MREYHKINTTSTEFLLDVYNDLRLMHFLITDASILNIVFCRRNLNRDNKYD